MAYLANALGDANNLGFFATPTDLTNAYPIGAPGYFAIVGSTGTLWVWDPGTSAWVDSGAPGADAFVYIAYASDDIGTDFTNTFDPTLDYIAIKSTTVQIPSPVAGDFVGLWKNYKGLHWMGTYGAGTSYKQGDAVAYLGTSYIYINATPGAGHTPADDTFWDILALKGTDGSGAGDVNGPASSVADNFASFSDTTGKNIKDSGKKASDFATAAQGTLASNAVPNTRTVVGKALSSDITIALDDLSDVIIATPLVDQILKYNGANWVNGATTNVNGGSGVDFFPSDVAIVSGPTSDSTINTLSKTPNLTSPVTDSRSVVAASSPLPIQTYLYNTVLGGTQIDAGVWDFDIWAMTSSATGSNLVLVNINQVKVQTGTVTMTGVGTTRTVTASGTPFVAGDASTNQGNCSYIQTPGGIFPITAFISSSVVTITTPAGYSDESTVAFSIWYKLFQVQSNELTTANSLSTAISTQPAFALGATDKLGAIYLGAVTSGTHTISYIHSNTTQYTHFNTPLVVRHNDLAGLQGGTTNEYYHLTSAEYTGSGTGAFARVDSPVFTTKIQSATIELGAATDTTITRVSAGVIAVEGNTLAQLNSPTFTGTPSLPTGTTAITQSANDNSTKLATTAYVQNPGKTVQTVTAMGAQALDGSLGNVFTRTLAASETFTQSNFTTGQCFMVEVKQGSGTSYTVTWFATVTWVTTGGTAPVQTTTTNGITTYGFRCTGSNTFLGYLMGTQ